MVYGARPRRQESRYHIPHERRVHDIGPEKSGLHRLPGLRVQAAHWPVAEAETVTRCWAAAAECYVGRHRGIEFEIVYFLCGVEFG